MRRPETVSRPALIGLCLCLLIPAMGMAQTEEEEELGWSNVTDLSLVVTEGNSSTETLGLKNQLRRHWKDARYTMRLDAVRSNTADDTIAVLQPGSETEYEVVAGEKTLDVEKYLFENRYDREISERFFWHAGLTWDRNKDAGIISRWVGFAGVGNIWWDREDLKFHTSYGLSYTDREEEAPDPEKDETFPGFRFDWEYLNQWGKNTIFENRWMFNTNISDTSDFTSDMTSSILVAMNSHVALRVSLQWLYNNLPSLQDLDLYRIVDGNLELLPTQVQEPKEKLDTVFSTSLVITF